MDKYEFKLSLDEINALIRERRFEEAANIADTIDWNHVKSVKTLGRIGEVYKIVGEFEQSRKIMEIAYQREPDNPSVVYTLCELTIHLYKNGSLQSDLARALQLMQEYQNLDPSNPRRLILQYKMYDVSHVSDEEKIAVLEQLKKEQPSARWEYELARLYAESGKTGQADQLCTDVAEIFGGRYGEKSQMLRDEIRAGAYARAGAGTSQETGEDGETGHSASGVVTQQAGPRQEPDRDVRLYDNAPEETAPPEQPSRRPVEETPFYGSDEPSYDPGPAYEEMDSRGYAGTYAERPAASRDGEAADIGTGRESDVPEQKGAPGQVTDTETSINEVMAEWERIRADIRRANDEKRAQRILEDTGNILHSFDETARHGLLEDIEKGVARQRRQVRSGRYGTPEAEAGYARPQRGSASGYDEAGYDDASSGTYYEPEEGPYRENGYVPGDAYESQRRALYRDEAEYEPDQAPYDEEGYGQEFEPEYDRNDEEGAYDEPAYAGEPSPDEGSEYDAEPVYDEEAVYDEKSAYDEEPVTAPRARKAAEADTAAQPEDQEEPEVSFYDEPDAYDEPETASAPAAGEPAPVENARPSSAMPVSNEDDDVRIYDGPSSDAATRRWNAEEVHRAIRSRVNPPAGEQEPLPAEETYPEQERSAREEEFPEPQEETVTAPAASHTAEKEPGVESDFFDETDEWNLPQDLPAREPQGEPVPAPEEEDAEEAPYPEEDGRKEEPLPEEEAYPEEEAPKKKRPARREEFPETPQEEETGEPLATAEDKPADQPEPKAKEAAPQKSVSTVSTTGKRELTREERRLFGPFCRMKENVDQLTEALEQISLSSTTGNLIILGNEATADRVAKGILDITRRSDPNFIGKIAKASGESLNKLDAKGFARTFRKLENGALIIVRASDIAPKTMERIYKELELHEHGLILILTDGNKKMEQFRQDNGKYLTSFTAVINIRPLDDKALVSYAKDYAMSQDYSIDEFGQLALAQRISSMQTQSHHVTLKEVRDLVDEAIGYASKKNFNTLMEVVSRKRYDEDDRIILHEKDFTHY